MEFAICALWVRSFLSGPGTGGRIRYYPTDREPNSETVRIPRSPRIKRYRAFWSSSRWRLFCPSPWFPRRGSSASPPRRFGGSLLRHSVEARRRLLLGDSEARCSAIAWCQQVPSYAALSFPDSSSVFLGHLCLWFSRSTIWLHLWCICGSISWRMSLVAFASPGRALSQRQPTSDRAEARWGGDDVRRGGWGVICAYLAPWFCACLILLWVFRSPPARGVVG